MHNSLTDPIRDTGAKDIAGQASGPIGAAVVLSASEEQILRCLGAAVVEQWSILPTNVQRGLFARASALGAPRQLQHLKEQIAAFLRAHRHDGPSL